MQAGRSWSIIHYKEYEQNFKNFLELRIGRKKCSKEFILSSDLLSTKNEYNEVYSRKFWKMRLKTDY